MITIFPAGFLIPSIPEHLGDKLAEILHKEGSFAAMEIRVKQVVSQEETDKTIGGWHTDVSLEKLGWNEPQP